MIDYSESWLILTLLKWKGPSAQDRIVGKSVRCRRSLDPKPFYARGCGTAAQPFLGKQTLTGKVQQPQD